MESSLLERIGHAFRAAFLPTVKTLRDPSLTALFSSSAWTDSTATVTETTALKYPAVWAAVQVIAGDVASLPFFHYKRRPDGGKERYTASRLYRVLHNEFNPEMSAFVGRETMTAHCLLWGNAYAEIVRNDLGQVVALWPIEPNRVMPERAAVGSIVYRVSTGDGRQVLIPADRMLHVVGLGFNGLMGYSVIGMHSGAIGVGLSTQKLGGDVMSRGAKYSGFFEHPRTLGATAHKNLKEALATDLPGSYRILEEGMQYKSGSMPLRDAQFMELQKYGVTEVARIFGIPPHKLGDLERATFSNIEEQNIDYVMWTLRRWLERWEQECDRKLIAPLEKTQQFCEHLIDGATRGNIASRYAAYNVGRNGGWLSANDIREFENQNPIPGGDTYLVQGAMVPLDRLDDLVDAQVRPPPAPVPPPDAPQAEDPAARVVATLVAELRAESRAASVAALAGRLCRRELAQVRKRAADPTAAVMRLERFYRRFVGEGVAELAPWIPNPVTREQVLTAWAEGAMRSCVTAVQSPGGLAALVRIWERDREPALRQMLEEVCHGT